MFCSIPFNDLFHNFSRRFGRRRLEIFGSTQRDLIWPDGLFRSRITDRCVYARGDTTKMKCAQRMPKLARRRRFYADTFIHQSRPTHPRRDLVSGGWTQPATRTNEDWEKWTGTCSVARRRRALCNVPGRPWPGICPTPDIRSPDS